MDNFEVKASGVYIGKVNKVVIEDATEIAYRSIIL